MTNKEAIRILGLECDDWETSHCTPSERREAFDMAISALQAQDIDACRVPEVAKDTNVLNNDTISRQAALYAIYEICNEPVAWLFRAAREIEKLPSAEPEIIRCRDCRWRKDQSGSTAWLPCRAIATPSDFYCGRAERRTDESDK